MRGKLFSEQEINWLKINYPLLGAKECATQLNRTIRSVKCKIWLMGIKLHPNVMSKIKSDAHFKNFIPQTDINDWIDIKKPEIAYILGLLWADGHVPKPKTQTHSIVIGLVKEDFDKIVWIFDRVGTWRKSIVIPTKNPLMNNQKEVLKLTLLGKDISKYLLEMDYGEKSFKAPYKILEKIPEHLKHYFFSGYLDGDRCIALKYYDLVFTSTYEQDWGFLPKNFYIKRGKKTHIKTNITGKYSRARLCRKEEMLKYCEYLYKNANIDKIYLPRKYERYLLLKSKAERINREKLAKITQCNSSNPPSLVE